MIDFARLLHLVEDMAPPDMPDMPDMQKEEAGQQEATASKIQPDMPDMPDLETGEVCFYSTVVESPEEACLQDVYNSSLLENMSGMSGMSGEQRPPNGYSGPTCPSELSGNPEMSGADTGRTPEWTCPLGHREFWVSDYGLNICSKCHPKANRKRRTP